VQFARHEIKTELKKGAVGASFFAAGVSVAFVGILMLCLTLVFLLHWLGAPAGADPSVIPLWGCFGIVAVFSLIAGAVAFLLGKRTFDDVGTPLHESAQTMKENIEWITKTRRS